MAEYSVSPAGEKFTIPEKEEYAAEFERVETLARERSRIGLVRENLRTDRFPQQHQSPRICRPFSTDNQTPPETGDFFRSAITSSARAAGRRL